MVVHSPDSGFSSISITSSSKQAINPIGITKSTYSWYNTHSFRIGGATSAAEADVSQATIQQLGRWRSQAYRCYIRPPQKAPALCEATATAGSTSASRQAQELIAGCIAGGSINELHALSRTETAAHKYTHTLYCISPYITMLAGYTLGFSSHIKRIFFSWNLNSHWVPNFSISLVGPQPIAIHFVVTILILSTYTVHIVAFLRVHVLPLPLSLWNILKGQS